MKENENKGFIGKGQRGLDDKIMYNKYNRGAEIIRDDSHIKPSVDPVVYDMYKESVTEDIVALREWDDMCNLIFSVYENSDFYFLDRSDPAKVQKIFVNPRYCIDELRQVYEELRSVLLEAYPDASEKEMMFAICESLQINYKKVWDSVLSPIQKSNILSTINLKDKVNNSKLSSSLF